MCSVFVAFIISFTVSSTQWIPYLIKPRLIALVLCWWFYDCEVVMIWEFILLIFKSEDTVFLCHLLTACLLQHSPICLFFFFLSASLPPSSSQCWLCLTETSSPFVSWYCPWTEQNPHEWAMSWVTYLCHQRSLSPLTRFCLVLVAQLVTAHACSSMWPSSLPQTV